jgi:protein-disulfide isomerase
MRSKTLLAVAATVLALLSTLVISSVAQTGEGKAKDAAPPANSPEQAQLTSHVESYLRNLFAWGPTFQVKLGPLSQSLAPDFYDVPVQVTYDGHTDTGDVYVSKDGKYILRGEIRDINRDPFAETRKKLHLEGSPSKGPADAAVTVVDFSDYECPHCRELARVLKEIQPKYPQVRFVSKSFPLVQIHPWAMQAAIAARCVYQHSPDAYWMMHDEIFENQDLISPENAWDKLTEYATLAGVPQDQFKACMTSPDAKAAIEADVAEGKDLGIASTPTVYVNGRELVGGDESTLNQYISFELSSRHLSPPR